MHPALTLPEILEAVFHQVDLQPAGGSETGYAALAIAARCCRHFCEPALDRLWAYMNDLLPLLYLLPGLLQLQGTFILHRSMRRGEWTRLISYSKRIRVLHYTNDPSLSPNIDASVFMQLYRLSHHQPLFSRLRVLVITAARLPVPELLIFQSDRLVRLDFHTKKDHTLLDHTFPSFLASLSDECHLRSLSIVGRTSHLVVASLLRFPLRSLTICRQPWRIDGLTLNTIAKLEHLGDLQLDLWDTDFKTVERSLHTVDLEKLSLRGDIRSISTFMQKFPITPNSLRSVTLAEFDAGQTLPSANLWKDIFMACARHSSSLRSIKASIHNTTGAITMHPCTPGMPFLEPLLECRLLHDILMVGFPPISLHEHEIATIACTWPSLYSLCLPHSPSNHTPSAAALYSFANHCPNLRSLTISVHTRGALAQQSVVQRLEPNQPSLEKLTILSQPVGSPAAEVLDLLLAIFPTLKSVDSLLDRSWDTVTDLLRAQRINTHATGDSPW